MEMNILKSIAFIFAMASILSCNRYIRENRDSNNESSTRVVDTLYIIDFRIDRGTGHIHLKGEVNNVNRDFILDSEFEYHLLNSTFVLSLFDTTQNTFKKFENGYTDIFCIHPLDINIQNNICHSDTIQLSSSYMHNSKFDYFGILGRPFFEHSVVCINFDNNKIYIVNKVPNNISEYASTNYSLNKKNHRVLTLRLPAKQDSITTNLIFDFGSPFSDIYKEIKNQITIPNIIESLDIGSVLLNRAVAIKYKIDVDAVHSQTGEIIDNPYLKWGCDGAIGMDIIKQYNLIIDYQHNKIYYTPNDNFKKYAE